MDDSKTTKIKFSEIMTGLAENYSAKLSKPGMSMRFEALKQFDIADIESAAIRLLADVKISRMPTVAEFIDAMGALRPERKDIAAGQATLIVQWVRELGSYREPSFDDPVTRGLMKSRWTWRSVCAMTESEMKWWVKEFIEAYQSIGKPETHIAITGREIKQLASTIGR